jgi:hypothetical protein
MLISDKVDFKLKLVKRDKESHFILRKSNASRRNNNYQLLHNVNALNFIKRTLKDLKSHIDPNIVVVGDFNTALSTIDRSSRQKNHQINL